MSTQQTALPINPEILLANITQLRIALETRSPEMRILCHTIHAALKQDSELVSIMKEEDVQLVVTSLGIVQQKEILFSSTKAKGTKKALSRISADDL